MLNLQRNTTRVNAEYRADPRIEFHYPVVLIGYDAKARIIDFSLGGFYIETDTPVTFAENQKIRLFLRFPEERAGVTVKVEVVHQDPNGFGCKLYDVQPDANFILSKYFNMYAGMLPIE